LSSRSRTPALCGSHRCALLLLQRCQDLIVQQSVGAGSKSVW
jgi:hypothetical protein